MFNKLIDNLHKRRLEKIKREQAIHDAEMERRYRTINEAKADMLQKPCPLNNMEACIDTCVHFKNGYIKNHVVFHEASTDMWEETILPKCRLWRD